MSRFLKNKFLVVALLCGLTISTARCGILMHPERKGQTGGQIDTTALILDCLWLFAGVVPGVAALVIDFVTGGIYGSGSAMNVEPGQKFTFNLRGPAPLEAEVAVKLQDPDGRTVFLLDRDVARGDEIGPMKFALPTEMPAGKYSLSLTVNDDPKAKWGLNVASAQE